MNGVTIVSGEARLEVARLGAEAQSWRVGDVDLLWPGDPAIWAEISPLLFPVVGWTRDGARVAGRQYELGLHGFARRLIYEVEREAPGFVRLVARDDATTRAVYPFAFAFAVEYEIAGAEWRVTLEVANTGAEVMPYACGLHPGFRLGEGPSRAVFAPPERMDVPVMKPGGLIGAERRTLPFDGVTLAIDDPLFANDALCFVDSSSRSLRFERADGTAVEMERGDFPHAALWRRPHAPFLCLEAWTGYSDPEGFTGDLFAKPSMRTLAPGARARHVAVYRFHTRA